MREKILFKENHCLLMKAVKKGGLDLTNSGGNDILTKG